MAAVITAMTSIIMVRKRMSTSHQNGPTRFRLQAL